MTQKRLDWESLKDRWPNSGASHFIRAGELCWHVQIAGQADAPSLLLIHGSAGSTHSWAGLLPDLARDFRVIAPDLPGHAFTDAPSLSGMTLPGMANALASLLAELDVKPDLVVGHSAGAAIALHMAAVGIISPHAIVSLNGAIQPFRGIGRHLFPAMARLVFLNPFAPRLFARQARDKARVGDLMRRTGSDLSDADIAWYRMLFSTEQHVNGALRMMASWDLESLQGRLGDVPVPVVLVAAEDDGFVPADDVDTTIKRLRNAEIRRLPARGHLNHEEDPAETAALVRDIWAKATVTA